MTSSSERHKVQLAIYDLSGGMAQSLSRQFLGPNHSIDMIPHSGVLVYGLEYYFGGGIQSSPPTVFRRQHGGIQPVMILDVGFTNVSRAEFEVWCRTVAALEYSPTSYDLLQRNCNNFADYALRDGLHLSDGVPQWVLDVPLTFLSSPLGGMLRPMLEQMQMTAPPVGASTLNSATTFTSTPIAETANVTSENPWANISVDISKPTAPAEPQKNETKQHGTPLLDSHTKPLLSTDISTVPLAVTKLFQAVKESDLFSLEEADSINKSLESIKASLLVANSTLQADNIQQSLSVVLRSVLLCEATEPFDEKLVKNCTSILSYTFMLLRLVVLRRLELGQLNNNSVHECAELVMNHFFKASPFIEKIKSASSMAVSMAWCVLSNGVGASTDESAVWKSACQSEEMLLNCGMTDCLGHPKKEVRQAASAFLYNCALYQSLHSAEDVLNDTLVSVLCCALENLQEEQDEVVLFRRLLLIATLAKTQSMALCLCVDLGLTQVCQEIAARQCQQAQAQSLTLASELCSLLSAASS